jgi:hypothetical protein
VAEKMGLFSYFYSPFGFRNYLLNPVILFGLPLSLLSSVLVISSNLLEKKDYYYLWLMLLACQHWFVVDSAMPRGGSMRSLGGNCRPSRLRHWFGLERFLQRKYWLLLLPIYRIVL